MHLQKKILLSLIATIILLAFQSCYKKDIQFGNDLGNTYTNLTEIDTISVNMSTVLLDSFATNGGKPFLLGHYKDPFFGTITAKPYFQLGLPSSTNMETNAIYDSLTLILKLNKYYYGDTTKTETVQVNELSVPIDFSYNNQLFNTSSVPEKPLPLGSKPLTISPSNSDSIEVRLSDAKGSDLFNKLVQKDNAVLASDQFLNYFKGLSVSFSNTDAAAIIGVGASSDSIRMRLYYHINTPYTQNLTKDFLIQNNQYSFNQIRTDRTGTPLNTSGTNSSGRREILASQTNDQAFSQTAAGVLLKLTFPTLKDVLKAGSIVKLLKATLILRPTQGTYDLYNFKLPQSLHLALTNGSNAIGTNVNDTTGSSILYSQPVIDNIYNTNTSYSFNVTSAINNYLTTGTTDVGFYLLQDNPGITSQLNRVILNDGLKTPLNSQLILSVLTIKN